MKRSHNQNSIKEAYAKVFYVEPSPGDVTRNPGKAWACLRSGVTIFK